MQHRGQHSRNLARFQKTFIHMFGISGGTCPRLRLPIRYTQTPDEGRDGARAKNWFRCQAPEPAVRTEAAPWGALPEPQRSSDMAAACLKLLHLAGRKVPQDTPEEPLLPSDDLLPPPQLRPPAAAPSRSDVADAKSS